MTVQPILINGESVSAIITDILIGKQKHRWARSIHRNTKQCRNNRLRQNADTDVEENRHTDREKSQSSVNRV